MLKSATWGDSKDSFHGRAERPFTDLTVLIEVQAKLHGQSPVSTRCQGRHPFIEILDRGFVSDDLDILFGSLHPGLAAEEMIKMVVRIDHGLDGLGCMFSKGRQHGLTMLVAVPYVEDHNPIFAFQHDGVALAEPVSACDPSRWLHAGLIPES